MKCIRTSLYVINDEKNKTCMYVCTIAEGVLLTTLKQVNSTSDTVGFWRGIESPVRVFFFTYTTYIHAYTLACSNVFELACKSCILISLYVIYFNQPVCHVFELTCTYCI